MDKTILQRINVFFKKFPLGVLATCDGGRPHSRMFQCLWSEGRKFYFCTSSAKPVFRQLTENPHASFCTFRPDYSHVMSIWGSIKFINDLSLKQRALDENPVISGIYRQASNPVFTMFYLEAEGVERYSLAEGATITHFE